MVGAVLVGGEAKGMRFCIITKPGHNWKTRRAVERLLKSLGCRVTSSHKWADFCIMIGGDGTLLYRQAGIEIPILGIRTHRHQGRYMKASQGDFAKKIRALVRGRGYVVHRLPRLEALINDRPLGIKALNEVLIDPIYCRRMMETRVSLGKRKSVERNSGLVVHTPSGSSAFARSLGARRKGFGVIPIAPFSGRIKGNQDLGKGVLVEVLDEQAELCIDGQESQVWRLKKGDLVLVRKSPNPARLVAFSKSF